MQQIASQDASKSLLGSLVGDDCDWCGAGTLERGEFKGDEAVVCDDCGTPVARIW
jgi:hypothetical protein